MDGTTDMDSTPAPPPSPRPAARRPSVASDLPLYSPPPPLSPSPPLLRPIAPRPSVTPDFELFPFPLPPHSPSTPYGLPGAAVTPKSPGSLSPTERTSPCEKASLPAHADTTIESPSPARIESVTIDIRPKIVESSSAVFDNHGFLIVAPYTMTEDPQTGFLVRNIVPFVPTPRDRGRPHRVDPSMPPPPPPLPKKKAAESTWIQALLNPGSPVTPASSMSGKTSVSGSSRRLKRSYGETPLSAGMRRARDSTPAIGHQSSSVGSTPILDTTETTRLDDFFNNPGGRSLGSVSEQSVSTPDKPTRGSKSIKQANTQTTNVNTPSLQPTAGDGPTSGPSTPSGASATIAPLPQSVIDDLDRQRICRERDAARMKQEAKDAATAQRLQDCFDQGFGSPSSPVSSPPYELSPSPEPKSEPKSEPTPEQWTSPAEESSPALLPKSAREVPPLEKPSPKTSSEKSRGKRRQSSSDSSLPSARRRRSETPTLACDLIGHGDTTYAPVPPEWVDRAMDVLDTSHLFPMARERERTGKAPIIKGSKNGHYLAEHREKQGLPPRDPEYWRDDLTEEEQVKVEWQTKRREASPRWHQTMLDRITDSVNTNKWMNQTWGPPIKDEYGRPLQPSPRSGHPSSTKVLGPQYSGGPMETHKKRLSSDTLPDDRETKKGKKEHRKLTAPAMEREISPTPKGKATARIKPKLRVRKAVVTADGFCCICKALRAQDGGPLYVCVRCQKTTYCSLECRRGHLAIHETTCPDTEGKGKRVSWGKGEIEVLGERSIKKSEADDHVKPELSILDDPRNYAMDEPMDADENVRVPASGSQLTISPEMRAAMKSTLEHVESRFAFGQDGASAPEEDNVKSPEDNKVKSPEVAKYLLELNNKNRDFDDSINNDDTITPEAKQWYRKKVEVATKKAERLQQTEKLMQDYEEDSDEQDEAWYEADMEDYEVPDEEPLKKPRTPDEPKAIPPLGPIAWHRMTKYRMMEYLVRHGSCEVWRPAELLRGNSWLLNMGIYWSGRVPKLFTACMGKPHIVGEYRHSPYHRSVICASLPTEKDPRRLWFMVRDSHLFSKDQGC